MNIRNDLSKAILTGSAKQRITLLANHIGVLHTDSKGILSDNEFSKLTESFKTPQEINLYRKFKDIDEHLLGLLPYLNQLRLLLMVEVAKLDGYVFQINNLMELSEVINEVLYKIKDSKQKEDIIDTLVSNKYLFTAIKRLPEEPEFINIVYNESSLDKDSKERLCLLDLIEYSSHKSKEIMKTAKILLLVINEYIEINEFKVVNYLELLKDVETYLKDVKPIIPLHNFDYYPKYDNIEITEAEIKQAKEKYLDE